jgi:hypothetical protein
MRTKSQFPMLCACFPSVHPIKAMLKQMFGLSVRLQFSILATQADNRPAGDCAGYRRQKQRLLFL